MPSQPNITNITPPRVALVDPETGYIAREWYRFFNNLFVICGNGSDNPTLTISAAAPITTTGGTFPTIGITGAPLSKNNDTNVTLSLGGSFSTALVHPASISVGWQGVLSQARGGTGPWTTAGAVQVSQGPSTAPSWSNVKVAFGYIAGAGASVTQTGARTNSVTCNAPTGQITLASAAGSATPATFTVNNNAVSSTDTVILCIQSGATNSYSFNVSAVANGSFNVTFWAQAGTATDAPVLNYSIIKGASA
jgi:hypothetical protein